MEEPLTADQIFIRKLTDIVLANLANENFGVKELAHRIWNESLPPEPEAEFCP